MAYVVVGPGAHPRRFRRAPTSGDRDQRSVSSRPPSNRACGSPAHGSVPLGIGRRLPPERMRVVLDNLTARGSLAHFGIDISGMELRADDLDWSRGSGTMVRADAETLVLALSGRRPLPQPG